MAQSTQEDFPHYGDIWIVNLDPVQGAEIGKRRPALVVSREANNQHAATITVLPVTSAPAKRSYPDEVVIPSGVGGLSKDSRIKANMVRTVSKSRLVRPLGNLPRQYYSQIHRAIMIHLDIPSD
jgi:mRNA interferase MazF